MSDSLAKKFKIKCPEKINHDHTVLVVEDQQDMRLIVAHHLGKLGFKKIHQAANGYDALEFMKDTPDKISVIICATELPVMDGLTFLSELREDSNLSRPPFAITMNNPSKEKIMYSLENGVDEVMVKPFTLNDVMPKVQSTFSKFHNPNNPEKVYELAKSCYRAEKYEEASKIYSLIAHETKKSARPHVGLARIYIHQGKMEEALAELKIAEEKNEHFVHLYTARGQAYIKMGESEPAISAFKKAIDLSPLNPRRYEEVAKPLFAEKKFQEGVDILQIALSHELDFPPLHKFLSEGYFSLKDFPKAIKHIRTALHAEPENVVFLNQLGISLKESGELDEAMKVYNSIIKIDNDNKAAYYNKAILQYTKGSTEDAVKTLIRAMKKFVDFPQAAKKLAEYEKELNHPAA